MSCWSISAQWTLHGAVGVTVRRVRISFCMSSQSLHYCWPVLVLSKPMSILPMVGSRADVQMALHMRWYASCTLHSSMYVSVGL